MLWICLVDLSCAVWLTCLVVMSGWSTLCSVWLTCVVIMSGRFSCASLRLIYVVVLSGWSVLWLCLVDLRCAVYCSWPVWWLCPVGLHCAPVQLTCVVVPPGVNLSCDVWLIYVVLLSDWPVRAFVWLTCVLLLSGCSVPQSVWPVNLINWSVNSILLLLLPARPLLPCWLLLCSLVYHASI